MSVDLVLHNARIYTPKGIVEAGLAIDKGRILKIAKETNLPHASEKLDMKGKIVLPGLIDPHVHLRDQQLAYKEDFFSGTSAAAAGGVTLVIDMPNNKPVTMSATSLKERMKLAETQAVVNVAFHSAFPESLEEIPRIVKQGAVAFKLYLSQKIGGLDIEDDDALLRAFSKAGKMKVPVSVHPEDKKTLEIIKKEVQQAGRRDVDAYLKVHSPDAELKAVQHITQLAQKTNVHIHFCHVSSAEGLNAILATKNMGLPVSCEATPHHLLLSSKHLKHYRTIAVMDPPLRTEKDVETLWKALRQGLIDAVASDHAPHTIEEKNAESVWELKPGIPGLETTLPLLLTQVNEGRLAMSDLIRVASKRPAEIFHLRDRGSLAEGCWADLVVVDLKRKYRIDSSNFYSKAKYSPFDGWKVRGKPIKTFVNGQLVMDDGEIIANSGTSHILR
ncbi:MAG: dihydroorotase family protein [Candidatus Bathyarchaeota archaeon]|nr:MAG: dihydroorotase family protein [Candidatus Bathyarchaeota archaeon]